MASVNDTVSSKGEESFLDASHDQQELVDESEYVTWDKRIHSVTDIDLAANFDLDLKIVLAKYAMRSKIDANDRTVLSKCLVRCFLLDNNDSKMRKPDFERVAALIVQRFPTETTSTYYIKATRKSRARGKLYDSYQHLRSELIKVGLASRNVYKTRTESEQSDCEDEEGEIIENDPKRTKSDLEYLEGHAGPWDQVTDIWNRTWNPRQTRFKDIAVLEYMSLYPALCTNRGLELLALDADKVQPNLPPLMNVLDGLSVQLLEKINELGPLYPFNQLVVGGASRARTHALILISLPYFMPTVYSRVNNKSVRLSKAEVSSRFFPYFLTKVERDAHYEQSQQTAETYRVPLAPSIHLFGNFDNPMCIVTIERREYFFDNPVLAFELYFKSLFALDLQYPEGCEHVWFFVQKKLFGFTTDKDPIFPAVETLIASL